MKKRILFLSTAIALSAIAASAAGKWTLQSKEYTVDTLFHAKIGPGTTQTSLHLTGGSNLKVFYTTTDLTDPYVDIRVAQAGARLTGGAKLSAMSNANTDATTGIEYFAGVNADFFGNSQPIGSSVVNGDPYKASNGSGWINWYMNDSKVPGIEKLTFGGRVIAPNGEHALSVINDPRYTDYLVLFNSHYGATTGTNIYGTEVLVSCDKTIGYNGTYTCKVESAPVSNVGGMTIPAGKYVLSGNGTASTFLQGLKAGDEITLDLNTPLATGGVVTQMAGGMPIILQNGETLNTQTALDHLTALNPRTAVGYSADRTKLVLLVVDGRNMGGSVGVVSKVLADIMREVGCADAMNFDGGGSSELYTRAFGVRNVPSDGSERTVVNSVWAVATAPADREVSELMFTSPSITLPRYGYYVPTFYAYNKYGVLLSTDFKGATLSCDPELGQIVDGTILFANGTGTHKLTATFNGVTTSINVTIGTAEPRARLADGVVVDSYRDYRTEIVADVEGEDMSIDNQALTWTVDNADVATVDDAGIVHGVANGTAVVTAKVDNLTATLPVTVQIPATRYLDIDADGDLSGWTTTKSGLSVATLSRSGKGFAVDYKISSARGPSFTVKPVEPMDFYALPDSIRFVINPGEGSITKMTLKIGPKGERVGNGVSYDLSLKQGEENVVMLPVSDFCDADDFASYPLSFTSAAFYVSGSVGNEAHVDIPAIQGVHTAVSAQDGVAAIMPDAVADGPGNIAVARGYVIELDNPGAWTVYDMRGVIVARGSGNAIDTALFAPGAYVLSANGKSGRLVIK